MRKKQEIITDGTKTMTREELTRTQVLNLSDFEKVAKYEKKTSKRPAIFLAILGVFCLIAGFSYNPIMDIVIDKITPPAPVVSRRVTEKNEIITNSDTVVCHYALLGREDGIDYTLTLSLTFYNDTLATYTKTMGFVATLGKEELAQQAINITYPIFKDLEQISIPNYKTETKLIENGFETTTVIEPKNFNPALLTTTHNAYPATNYDFEYGTKEETIQRAESYGYTCDRNELENN